MKFQTIITEDGRKSLCASKAYIAYHHLVKAIIALLRDNDALTAIFLASASGDITRSELKKHGVASAHDKFYEMIGEDKIPIFKKIYNFSKHNDQETFIHHIIFSEYFALGTILLALDNFSILGSGYQTFGFSKFQNYIVKNFGNGQNFEIVLDTEHENDFKNKYDKLRTSMYLYSYLFHLRASFENFEEKLYSSPNYQIYLNKIKDNPGKGFKICKR